MDVADESLIDGRNKRQSLTCAVCKHQRRGCGKLCIFSPHFPSGRDEDFKLVRKHFGASNLMKRITEQPDHESRSIVVESMIWEATIRENEPLKGSYGVVQALQEQVQCLMQALDMQTLLQQQQQQQLINCGSGTNYITEDLPIISHELVSEVSNPPDAQNVMNGGGFHQNFNVHNDQYPKQECPVNWSSALPNDDAGGQHLWNGNTEMMMVHGGVQDGVIAYQYSNVCDDWGQCDGQLC